MEPVEPVEPVIRPPSADDHRADPRYAPRLLCYEEEDANHGPAVGGSRRRRSP